MLSNEYLLAKFRFDTAENEQHFAEILPKTGNYPTGPRGAGGRTPAAKGPTPARPTAVSSATQRPSAPA